MGGADLASDDAPPATDALALDSASAPDVRDAAAFVYAGDLKKSLALYLPFDEKAGTAVASDASGKKSAAALKNIDAKAAWGAGRFGEGLALKGAGWAGWVDVSGTSLANVVSQSFSVALWIWRNDDSNGTLIARRSAGAGVIFSVELEGGQLAAQMNTGAAYKVHVVGGVAVPTGRWVHVAMTYDVRQIRLYVDGKPAGATAYLQALPLDTTSFIVGGLEQTNRSVSGLFAGQVDDLVLFTRALSDADVGALAAGARPGG